MVKHLSTMRETRVRSLGWEDPLEKEMAIHSRTIAWKIHGQRSLVGYSPWGRKESDMTERLHFTSLHFTSMLSLRDHTEGQRGMSVSVDGPPLNPSCLVCWQDGTERECNPLGGEARQR